jgi:predicted type IV restriction endonuclease
MSTNDELPQNCEDATTTKPSKDVMPKWQAAAVERVRAALRKFAKPLADLAARDANEGDTRLLVTDFLCEGLGYDKYSDLTTEYLVKGEYADYGVRIDRELIAFIEVKRVATKLSEKHLRQVQMYAVNEGVEWVFLTNGIVWKAYHLTGGLPVVTELAFSIDLSIDTSPSQKAGLLFYLSKDAMKRRLIDELWSAKVATSPKSIAHVLMSDVIVEAIRKQLRKQSGHNVDLQELKRVLAETVLREQCFD